MKRTTLVLATLALLAAAPGRGLAGFTPAVDFNLNFVPPTDLGSPATLGFSFSTGNAPVTIDAVGLLSITPPNGQTVRIYQDGTTTNLLSVTIPSNAPLSSLTPDNNNGHRFAYESIPPLTLLPNHTYDIVADLSSTDLLVGLATPIVNAPDITFGAARLLTGATGQFPTDNDNFFDTVARKSGFPCRLSLFSLCFLRPFPG
jgi:hypothetical protein